MKNTKKIIGAVLLFMLLLSLLTVFVSAESNAATMLSNALFWVTIVLVAIIGILLPILPIVWALIRLFKTKTDYPVPQYIAIIASAIWFAMGVVIFILILV